MYLKNAGIYVKEKIMDKKISIRFLGGAGTVTGSKYLVTALGKNILVDCGMFQGLKKLRLLNWDILPVKIPEIDLVLLTHAHLDHSGYLPKLVTSGFKGKIMATAPTLQIAETILKDSAKIGEEQAEKANREGFSKHKPAKPLYTSRDVEAALKHFEPQPEGQWLQLFAGIRARFMYNGHIVGSTFIELEISNKRLVFSGDLGRENDVLLYPPKRPEKADIIFIESTYGNVIHPSDPEEKLKGVINETVKRNGTVIIPSFAVERTQSLMYMIWKASVSGEIPDIPVYMDSPMGQNILEIFRENPQWHKLSPEDCLSMQEKIASVHTMKETYKVAADKRAKIVIAGSGMATGGRVLSYFQTYLPDRAATIMIVGFQAEGTRGRQLLDGARELKLFGKYYPVKAHIENIRGLSAHADQKGLLDWLKDLPEAPEKLFIVHGEAQAADALRVKIKDTYNWDSVIPELYDSFEIYL
jgi:metallo-beta-lactamase family protein